MFSWSSKKGLVFDKFVTNEMLIDYICENTNRNDLSPDPPPIELLKTWCEANIVSEKHGQIKIVDYLYLQKITPFQAVETDTHVLEVYLGYARMRYGDDLISLINKEPFLIFHRPLDLINQLILNDTRYLQVTNYRVSDRDRLEDYHWRLSNKSNRDYKLINFDKYMSPNYRYADIKFDMMLRDK